MLVLSNTTYQLALNLKVSIVDNIISTDQPNYLWPFLLAQCPLSYSETNMPDKDLRRDSTFKQIDHLTLNTTIL